MKRQHWLGLSLASFALTLACAFADPSADDLAAARRRLEAWRKFHPDEVARLQANLKTFQELPERRREAILKLDHDLHALPEAKRTRYGNALDRYADWLERLQKTDPKAWQAIKDAPDSTRRLALIVDRREREWMESQPKPYRDQWDNLPVGEARAAFTAKLRNDERVKREHWIISQRFWRELDTKQTMPCRLGDFPDKVRNYVTDFLLPYLPETEKKRLAGAEGRWPDYPMTLVEIAAARPSALPPTRKEELPQKFSQLPVPVQARLVDKKAGGLKLKVLKELHQYEGPSFATKTVEIAFRENKLPFGHEYLACNFKSLTPAMQEFVTGQLIPALADNADRRKLTDNEGRWPYYPQTIQELALKHQLTPPWHYLPDAEKHKWDQYRKPKRPKSVMP